jgi:hypothetical protein
MAIISSESRVQGEGPRTRIGLRDIAVDYILKTVYQKGVTSQRTE